MSTNIFPSLIGLGFDVVRTPMWSGVTQQAVSGKITRIAYWTYPLWRWELSFEFLRSDASNAEWQQLVAFFNTVRGPFDSWLFNDVDDNTVVGQSIGTGGGAQTAFQMLRTLGGFAEPIYAPDTNAGISATLNVYVAGVLKTNGVDYNISAWGAASPGVITFVSPPSGAITADFSYYWPVHFLDYSMDFNKFMNQLWRNDKVAFENLR